MTGEKDEGSILQSRKTVQPWRYFAVIVAVFLLLLPKYGLFTSYNGALGILLGTAGLCVLHRLRAVLGAKSRTLPQGMAKRLFSVVRLLWYIAVFTALTGSSARFVRDCFWTGMSDLMAWMLLLCMLLPAWGKRGDTWQRMIAVSGGWLSLFVAGLPLLGIRQMDGAFLPVDLSLDVKQIFLAAGLYLLASWYLLLLPESSRKGMWPDSREGLYLLLGGFLAFVCVLFRQVYGREGAAYRRWPVLSLLQGISVPGKFLERVDAVWAGAFLFAMFLAAGLLLERIFSCLRILGVKEGSVRLWRWKDLLAFGVLAILVFVYRYSGVEVQDRAYVGAFVADWEEDGYVFWFPLQEKGEVTKLSAKSFADAREIFGNSQNLQPDFGHIEATVFGEKLLENQQMTERLFAELAAWQEMDENSYVFEAAEPEVLMTADTGENGMGKYLSELCENRFGPAGSYLTLQKLLVTWENGSCDTTLPRVTEKDGCLWILPAMQNEA